MRSSRPCCLHLEMLFKVWQGDLRKAVTAKSTHARLWFVQLSAQGRGLHSVFLPQCLGTSLAFTLTLNAPAMPGVGWGGVGWGGVGWGQLGVQITGAFNIS